MIDKEKKYFYNGSTRRFSRKESCNIKISIKEGKMKKICIVMGSAPGAFAVGMRGEIGARSRPSTGGRLLYFVGAGIRRSSGGAGRCVPKNACKYAGFYNNMRRGYDQNKTKMDVCGPADRLSVFVDRRVRKADGNKADIAQHRQQRGADGGMAASAVRTGRWRSLSDARFVHGGKHAGHGHVGQHRRCGGQCRA